MVADAPGASSPCVGEIENGDDAPRKPSGPLNVYQVIGAPPGLDTVTVADGLVRPRSTLPADSCNDPGVVVVVVGLVVAGTVVVVGGGGGSAGGAVVVVVVVVGAIGLALSVGVVDVVTGSVVVVVDVVDVVLVEVLVEVEVLGAAVVLGTTGGAAATVVAGAGEVGFGDVVVVDVDPMGAVATCSVDPSART